MKNNVKKVFLTVLVVVLVFGCGVGTTLAWLIAQTNTVTNTFAVGNITIDLQETVDGEPASAKRNPVKNDNYKIVPGASQSKDPKVIVEKGSEKCYVYVCVENNLVVNGTIVGTLNIDTLNKWRVVGTSGNKTVYCYKEAVDATNDNVKLPVFDTVTYADTIAVGDMDDLAGKTVVISAYAHQSENVGGGTTTTDAAALAHFKLTPAAG